MSHPCYQRCKALLSSLIVIWYPIRTVTSSSLPVQGQCLGWQETLVQAVLRLRNMCLLRGNITYGVIYYYSWSGCHLRNSRPLPIPPPLLLPPQVLQASQEGKDSSGWYKQGWAVGKQLVLLSGQEASEDNGKCRILWDTLNQSSAFYQLTSWGGYFTLTPGQISPLLPRNSFLFQAHCFCLGSVYWISRQLSTIVRAKE